MTGVKLPPGTKVRFSHIRNFEFEMGQALYLFLFQIFCLRLPFLTYLLLDSWRCSLNSDLRSRSMFLNFVNFKMCGVPLPEFPSQNAALLPGLVDILIFGYQCRVIRVVSSTQQMPSFKRMVIFFQSSFL